MFQTHLYSPAINNDDPRRFSRRHGYEKLPSLVPENRRWS
jgi:hypothetical protein